MHDLLFFVCCTKHLISRRNFCLCNLLNRIDFTVVKRYNGNTAIQGRYCMEMKDQKNLNRLFQAVLALKDVNECYEFFEDACTIKELQEIAQRFEVAEQLWQGKSYNEVNRQTGASTATICRVKKCLTYGNSGYKLILDRLAEQEV